MKPQPLARGHSLLVLLLFVVAIQTPAVGDDGAAPQAPQQISPVVDLQDWLAQAMTTLGTERRQVEQSLAADAEKASRADLLAMYGRTAAASGRFGASAAAYVMFLSEFGTDHTYSEQILARLGASLAPIDLRSPGVLHTADGPQYRPSWRMGKPASNERLQLAVGAYELLARVATDRGHAARALLSLGWVHRALNDWHASTAAWDRAAEAAEDSVVGADALWHAADNLAWTGQPSEAAKRLRRLTAEHPSDARAQASIDRIELLEAESRRTPKWFDDPVASLQAEIAERAAQREPHEVYRSAVQWLRTRRNTTAIIPVSRWATGQTAWPTEARLQAHYDLANALSTTADLRLAQPDAGDAAKAEAADVLGGIVSLSPTDDWAIPAAIRRSRLLSELKRFDAADKTLADIEARWKGNPQWEPSVLVERMQSLVDRGDLNEAKALQEQLQNSYPEYDLPAELVRTLATVKNGGGR